MTDIALTWGAIGSAGRVDVAITARATGNVNPPKIATAMADAGPAPGRLY